MKKLMILMLSWVLFTGTAAAQEKLEPDTVKSVVKSGQELTFVCKNNGITVMGKNNTIKLLGEVNRVTLMGESNKVILEGQLNELALQGRMCEFVWDPKIDENGFDFRVLGEGNKIIPPVEQQPKSAPKLKEPSGGFDGRWFLQPIDGANGKVPIPRGVAIAILFAVVGFGISKVRPSAAAKMMADAKVPERHWAQGAFGVLCTDSSDYGYANKWDTKLMLKEWWSIESEAALWSKLEELERVEDSAWDLCRAMLLTRSAAAVGWLSQDESWKRVGKQRELLQRAFSDWEEFGESVLRGRRRWLEIDPEGSQDSKDKRMTETLQNRKRLRKSIWKTVKYR